MPSAQEYQNPPSSFEKSIMGFKKKKKKILFNNTSELRQHRLEEQPSGAVGEGSYGSYLSSLWCVCVETN